MCRMNLYWKSIKGTFSGSRTEPLIKCYCNLQLTQNSCCIWAFQFWHKRRNLFKILTSMRWMCFDLIIDFHGFSRKRFEQSTISQFEIIFNASIFSARFVSFYYWTHEYFIVWFDNEKLKICTLSVDCFFFWIC